MPAWEQQAGGQHGASPVAGAGAPSPEPPWEGKALFYISISLMWRCRAISERMDTQTPHRSRAGLRLGAA